MHLTLTVRASFLFQNFLSVKTKDSTYTIDIGLQPIEANASVILNNIFFDVNQFELKPESVAELDKVVQLLIDNPAVKILISGHTDNTGKAADNIKLSENRAKAVVAYLQSKGIAVARLHFKGYGHQTGSR